MVNDTCVKLFFFYNELMMIYNDKQLIILTQTIEPLKFLKSLQAD